MRDNSFKKNSKAKGQKRTKKDKKEQKRTKELQKQKQKQKQKYNINRGREGLDKQRSLFANQKKNCKLQLKKLKRFLKKSSLNYKNIKKFTDMHEKKQTTQQHQNELQLPRTPQVTQCGETL